MDISFDRDGLRFDGKYWPLVSGQFEYWRHNPLFWGRILDLMREAGLETVATFVCWEFHEVERGRFDFSGETNPSRNLAGWLDLCHQKGLKVLLRIGPIHDAEWPSRGPALDVCTRERIDPEFLARTGEYIRAVSRVLEPRQLTHGGPIIALCLDNEVYFPYSTDVSAEPTAGSIPVPYNEALVLGEYRKWLVAEYKTIGALNKSWGTGFRDWPDVASPDYGKDPLPQTLASFRFISAAMERYFRELKRMCREAGLSVPTYVNTRQFTEYIDWPAIEGLVESQGINTYMGRCLPGDQGMVAQWYYRLQLGRRRFFWAAEFQSGVPIGMDTLYGILDPDHYRYFNQMAMALGLRGANWYMFVERDDWHWSPINPIGKVRPQYSTMKENIRILKNLVPDALVADLGLLWFMAHNQAFLAGKFKTWTDLQTIWAEFDQPKEFPDWWGTFRGLLDLDLDFALVDPRVGNPEAYSCLIYAGPDYVDPGEWQRVAEAVKRGSRLIMVTALPERNARTLKPDATVKATSAAIIASGRVIQAKPTEAGARALSLGVPQYVSSRPGGLWSTAFRSDRLWTVSVVNPEEEPVTAYLELARAIAEPGIHYQVTALVGKQQWTCDGAELGRLTTELAPKSVEIYQIRRAECA